VLIFDTHVIVEVEILSAYTFDVFTADAFTSDAFISPVSVIFVPDKLPVEIDPNVDLN
jgi:hypothetical protein